MIETNLDCMPQAKLTSTNCLPTLHAAAICVRSHTWLAAALPGTSSYSYKALKPWHQVLASTALGWGTLEGYRETNVQSYCTIDRLPGMHGTENCSIPYVPN